MAIVGRPRSKAVALKAPGSPTQVWSRTKHELEPSIDFDSTNDDGKTALLERSQQQPKGHVPIQKAGRVRHFLWELLLFPVVPPSLRSLLDSILDRALHLTVILKTAIRAIPPLLSFLQYILVVLWTDPASVVSIVEQIMVIRWANVNRQPVGEASSGPPIGLAPNQSAPEPGPADQNIPGRSNPGVPRGHVQPGSSQAYKLPHGLSATGKIPRMEMYEATLAGLEKPEVVGVDYDTASSMWKYSAVREPYADEYLTQRARLKERDERVLLLCPKSMVKALSGDSEILVHDSSNQVTSHKPFVNRLLDRPFDLPGFKTGELRCMPLSSYDVYHIKDIGGFLRHASKNHVAMANGGELMKKWAVTVCDVLQMFAGVPPDGTVQLQACMDGFEKLFMRGWAETVYLQLLDGCDLTSDVDVLRIQDWVEDRYPELDPRMPTVIKAAGFFQMATYGLKTSLWIVRPRKPRGVPARVGPAPAPAPALAWDSAPAPAPVYAAVNPLRGAKQVSFEEPSTEMHHSHHTRPGAGLYSPARPRDPLPCPFQPTPQVVLSDEELARYRTSVSLEIQQLRAEQLGDSFHVMTGKEMSERAGFVVSDVGDHAGPAVNDDLARTLGKMKDATQSSKIPRNVHMTLEEKLGIRPPPALHPSVAKFTQPQIARGEDKKHKEMEYQRLVQSVEGDLQPTEPAFNYQESAVAHALMSLTDGEVAQRGYKNTRCQLCSNRPCAHGSGSELSSMYINPRDQVQEGQPYAETMSGEQARMPSWAEGDANADPPRWLGGYLSPVLGVSAFEVHPWYLGKGECPYPPDENPHRPRRNPFEKFSAPRPLVKDFKWGAGHCHAASPDFLSKPVQLRPLPGSFFPSLGGPSFETESHDQNKGKAVDSSNLQSGPSNKIHAVSTSESKEATSASSGLVANTSSLQMPREDNSTMVAEPEPEPEPNASASGEQQGFQLSVLDAWRAHAAMMGNLNEAVGDSSIAEEDDSSDELPLPEDSGAANEPDPDGPMPDEQREDDLESLGDMVQVNEAVTDADAQIQIRVEAAADVDGDETVTSDDSSPKPTDA